MTKFWRSSMRGTSLVVGSRVSDHHCIVHTRREICRDGKIALCSRRVLHCRFFT